MAISKAIEPTASQVSHYTYIRRNCKRPFSCQLKDACRTGISGSSPYVSDFDLHSAKHCTCSKTSTPGTSLANYFTAMRHIANTVHFLPPPQTFPGKLLSVPQIWLITVHALTNSTAAIIMINISFCPTSCIYKGDDNDNSSIPCEQAASWSSDNAE